MSPQRNVGRPRGNIDARNQLFMAATELFMRMPFERVSTRLIAQKAGVNAALIRYYFGSKEGLFETMLREILSPMQQQLKIMSREISAENFTTIMRTHFSELMKIPQLPRLIHQIMLMSPSSSQRKLVEKVFMDIIEPSNGLVFEQLKQQGLLNEGLDPQLCQLSYVSLVIFPLIASPAMFSLHGFTPDEAFFSRLLEHNLQLLQRSLFRQGNAHATQ